MSQVTRTPLFPGEHAQPDAATRMVEGLDRTWGAVKQVRAIEFVAGFLLLSGIFIDLPFKHEALIFAVLVVIGLGRRPQWDLGSFNALAPLFIVLSAYVSILSYTADQSDIAVDWKGRLLRMMALIAATLVFASGRLHLKSTVLGFATAMVVNVPLFFAGLVSREYGDYLTGWASDKNYAGLIYCIVGIVLMAYARKPSHRMIVLIAVCSTLWLTGSRTSMAAFAGAMIWILCARYIGGIGRVILAGLLYWGVIVTAEDYSRIGRFSEREGSDLLRERIDTASEIKVEEVGFFGNGLGEAVVELDGSRWFFHNAYWTLLVEGGWPWMLAILGITIWVTIGRLGGALTRDQLYAQALAVALLVCAWRLGEVFITVPWVFVMAFSMKAWLGHEADEHTGRETAAEVEPA